MRRSCRFSGIYLAHRFRYTRTSVCVFVPKHSRFMLRGSCMPLFCSVFLVSIKLVCPASVCALVNIIISVLAYHSKMLFSCNFPFRVSCFSSCVGGFPIECCSI